MIWFRSANSHTGPQLHRCIRGRTDGSIRQRANPPKKPLALGGASTDEYTLLANNSAGSIPDPDSEGETGLGLHVRGHRSVVSLDTLPA